MKSGASFESFVAYVYTNLLDFSGCNSILSRNISIKGLDNVVHEYDIYYEFDHLNIRFRVAIECKDWERPIDKGRVMEFWAKVDALNNIAGVMISKNGYQSGAVEFAKSKGIMLLTIDDLPSFTEVVAERISRLLLPNDKAIGQPFWAIMEKYEDNVNGNYHSIEDDGKTYVSLFASRNIASDVLDNLVDKDRWCVRGVSQPQLKCLIDLSLELSHNDFALFLLPIKNNAEALYFCMDAEEIRQTYCS